MARSAHDPSLEIPSHVPPDRVVDLDLYRLPGAGADAHAAWKALQDSSPNGLFWTPHNGGHWIVTRGRDIAAVYADHGRFSSQITIVPREWGEQFPLRPTTVDPPDHRRYRRFLTAALSPATVRDTAETIRGLAAAAVERVRPQGRCDAIADFAAHIPLDLFLHLADIPRQEASALPRYAEDPRDSGAAATVPVMQQYADFLRTYVVARRQRPGADLISGLVTQTADGRMLTDDEAVDVAVALMTGGIDTIISQLGFLLTFLARQPEHRRQLVADPTRIRSAVGELLRRFPLMTKARVVRQDLELEGVTLKAGDMIVLPPLHGLDDREFADPMTVDFDRTTAPHSAFGNGVHRCPGASLAHLELEIALREWLTEIPEFEIDPRRPPQMRSGILSAVLCVGLQWDAAAPRVAGPRDASC